ncbi:MAG: hypothetical protein KF852_10760 [Saprospiraceae bacterium]|nr:hypothetical protein [Saprospiraceae bacterium]
MDQSNSAESILRTGADQWMNAARSWADMYKNAWEQALQSGLRTANEWGNMAQTAAHTAVDCCRPLGVCPPEPDCPPRCLAEIKRSACPGEVIVVPFNVKNSCGSARRYLIGMRTLVNGQGQPAPIQPWLDRTEINLEPGQTATVTLTVNLSEGFQPGDCYNADIVIRENKVNQNVCFQLCVTACEPAVEVRPLDEKRYLMRWQSWQDHFYCEQTPDTGRRTAQG